jgi:hypothetical protein
MLKALIGHIGQSFGTEGFALFTSITANTRGTDTSQHKGQAAVFLGDPQKQARSVGNMVNNRILSLVSLQ